jgi:hypothetical protein
MKMTKEMHEIVAVFRELEKMQEAIGELEVNSFNRLDISVLGNERNLKKVFGKSVPSTKQLEDNSNTPKSSNIAGEELGIAQGVIIGGGLVIGVAAVAVAVGAKLALGSVTLLILGAALGAVIGGFLAKMLGSKYAAFFQQQIDSGGLLLWVRTHSKADEVKASAICKKYGAHDVHVHTFA